MAPRTRKPGKPKIAFVLDEKKFRQLDALIKDLTDSDNLEYRVSLSDGSSITCESADEVLGVQNSRERRITSIWMDTPYRSEPRIEVKLNTEWYSDPVEYEVAGSEKDVFHSYDRLREYYSGVRQWYSFIAKPGLRMWFAFQAFLGLILVFSGYWLERLLGIELSANLGALILFSVGGFWTISLVVYLCFYALRKWLLPTGIFAIGDSIDRYNGIVIARKVIGGSIILALLVSLLASAISAQFS